MNVTKLAAWLARAPEDARGVQLYVLEFADTGSLLTEWTAATPMSPLDLATDVIAAAQAYADEQGKEQRFAVVFIRDEGKPRIQTIIKQAPEGKGSGYSAPSNVNDAIGQTLRHTEAMARIFVGAQQTALSTLKEVNADLRAQNHDNMSLLRDLLVRAKAVATDEDADDASRRESFNKAADAVIQHLLPRLADRVIGGVAPNGAAGPATTVDAETEH